MVAAVSGADPSVSGARQSVEKKRLLTRNAMCEPFHH